MLRRNQYLVESAFLSITTKIAQPIAFLNLRTVHISTWTIIWLLKHINCNLLAKHNKMLDQNNALLCVHKHNCTTISLDCNKSVRTTAWNRRQSKYDTEWWLKQFKAFFCLRFRVRFQSFVIGVLLMLHASQWFLCQEKYEPKLKWKRKF